MGGGGGKKGGGCATVGYGYTLNMAYALVENFDWLNGYSWNGNIEWTDWTKTDGDYNGETEYPFEIYVQTGKPGDVYASNIDHKSHIKVYNGSNSVDYPGTIPDNIKINKIGCAIFENAFVGDNTTSVPNYKFCVSRWKIFDGNIHKINEGADPVYVILEFLVNYMNIPMTNINLDSFEKASQVIINEGIGVSFILQKNNSIIDQIKDILRVIDGALYFDLLTQQWTLFLIRKDYESDDIIEVNDYNAKEISITTGDWSKAITTFIFTYTNYKTGKTESMSFRNNALIQILGQEKVKTYNFNLVSNSDAMSVIMNRVIKKNSRPLSTLKAQLNFLEIPNLHLGQVIKVQSDNLNIPEMYFRIMKIGADKEWQTYVEIEAIEDLFLNDYEGVVVSSSNIEPPQNVYTITSIIDKAKIFFLNNKFFNPNKNDLSEYLYTVFSSANVNSEFITGVKCYNELTTQIYNFPLFIYGKLQNSVSVPYFDREFEITLTNIEGNVKEVLLSDEDWQKVNILVNIGSSFFAFKNIIVNEDNTITLKGVISDLNGNYQVNFDSESEVYILVLSSLDNIKIIQDNSSVLNLDLALYNPYNIGEYTKYSATSDLTFINKPLPPSNLTVKKDDETNKIILQFYASARGDIAPDLKNADNVVGGDGEQIYERNIKYEVGYDTDSLYILNEGENPVFSLSIEDNGQDLTKFWVRSIYYDTYYSDKLYAKII